MRDMWTDSRWQKNAPVLGQRDQAITPTAGWDEVDSNVKHCIQRGSRIQIQGDLEGRVGSKHAREQESRDFSAWIWEIDVIRLQCNSENAEHGLFPLGGVNDRCRHAASIMSENLC